MLRSRRRYCGRRQSLGALQGRQCVLGYSSLLLLRYLRCGRCLRMRYNGLDKSLQSWRLGRLLRCQGLTTRPGEALLRRPLGRRLRRDSRNREE